MGTLLERFGALFNSSWTRFQLPLELHGGLPPSSPGCPDPCSLRPSGVPKQLKLSSLCFAQKGNPFCVATKIKKFSSSSLSSAFPRTRKEVEGDTNHGGPAREEEITAAAPFEKLRQRQHMAAARGSGNGWERAQLGKK